jgi:type II secretory pathway pseudopilin PulG
MLVVIAIIGILAAMLLPALIAAKNAANKMKAKSEMSALVTAITAYDADYSRFPVSPQAQAAANVAGGDFTYGGTITSAGGTTSTVQNPTSYSYQANNAEVIAILMDNTQNPVDANHQKNPKQVHYLNATPAASITSPGVGPDGVYRDPWGNPYIITMDLNYDEMCVDAFYGLDSVSDSGGGLNGLVPDPNFAAPNNWAFRGKVMVWSAGVDGQINATIPANQGVNKDNVLSWQ